MNFSKTTPAGRIIYGIKTDGFILSAPTSTLIADFTTMLAEKYTVRDL